MRRRFVGSVFVALLLVSTVSPFPAFAARGVALEQSLAEPPMLVERLAGALWGWLQSLFDQEKGQIVP